MNTNYPAPLFVVRSVRVRRAFKFLALWLSAIISAASGYTIIAMIGYGDEIYLSGLSVFGGILTIALSACLIYDADSLKQLVGAAGLSPILIIIPFLGSSPWRLPDFTLFSVASIWTDGADKDDGKQLVLVPIDSEEFRKAESGLPTRSIKDDPVVMYYYSSRVASLRGHLPWQDQIAMNSSGLGGTLNSIRTICELSFYWLLLSLPLLILLTLIAVLKKNSSVHGVIDRLGPKHLLFAALMLTIGSFPLLGW